MNDSLYMTLISILPRKQFARTVGRLAGWEGSSAISRAAVRTFAKRFQINLEEAAEPIENYPNLHSFFTRRLKEGVRPIDQAPDVVVSPVDGIMAEHGPIVEGLCTQVKGKTYTVDALLGGRGAAFQGGYFITIYLSPRHYHRIHSPVNGLVVRYHHLPGALWPVNGPSVRSVDQLFAINERLISYVQLEGSSQEVAVVKVGAVGVGRITLAYARHATNQPGQVALEQPMTRPAPVLRGDELGVFELGSTVVLVFPPGMIRDVPWQVGQEIKMGQRLATADYAAISKGSR